MSEWMQRACALAALLKFLYSIAPVVGSSGLVGKGGSVALSSSIRIFHALSRSMINSSPASER